MTTNTHMANANTDITKSRDVLARNILARMDTFHDFDDLNYRSTIINAMNDCENLKDDYFDINNNNNKTFLTTETEKMLNTLLKHDIMEEVGPSEKVASKYEDHIRNPKKDFTVYILEYKSTNNQNPQIITIKKNSKNNRTKKEDLDLLKQLEKQYEGANIHNGWIISNTEIKDVLCFTTPNYSEFFLNNSSNVFKIANQDLTKGRLDTDLTITEDGVWTRTIIWDDNSTIIATHIDFEDKKLTKKHALYFFENSGAHKNYFETIWKKEFTNQPGQIPNDRRWEQDEWKQIIKKNDNILMFWDCDNDVNNYKQYHEIKNNKHFWLQMYDVVIVDCDYGSYSLNPDSSSYIKIIGYFQKSGQFEELQLDDSLFKKVYNTGWNFATKSTIIDSYSYESKKEIKIPNHSYRNSCWDLGKNDFNNTELQIGNSDELIISTVKVDSIKVTINKTQQEDVQVDQYMSTKQDDVFVSHPYKIFEYSIIEYSKFIDSDKDEKNDEEENDDEEEKPSKPTPTSVCNTACKQIIQTDLQYILFLQPDTIKIVAKFHNNNNSDENNDNPNMNGGWINMTLNQEFNNVIRGNGSLDNYKFKVIEHKAKTFESRCEEFFEYYYKGKIGYNVANLRDHNISRNTIMMSGMVKTPSQSSKISSITIPQESLFRSKTIKCNDEKCRNIMDHVIELFFNFGNTNNIYHSKDSIFKPIYYLVDTGDPKISNRFYNIWSVVNEWDSSNDSSSKYFALTDPYGTFPIKGSKEEEDDLKYVFHKFIEPSINKEQKDGVINFSFKKKDGAIEKVTTCKSVNCETDSTQIFTTIGALKKCIDGTLSSKLDLFLPNSNKDPNIIAPYAFDIKRSGDALQVLRARSLNSDENKKGTIIFVTIDRLAFLHARILQTPAILISNTKNMITMFNPLIKDGGIHGGVPKKKKHVIPKKEYKLKTDVKSIENRLYELDIDNNHWLYIFLISKCSNIHDANRFYLEFIFLVRKIFPHSFGVYSDYNVLMAKLLTNDVLTKITDNPKQTSQPTTMLLDIIRKIHNDFKGRWNKDVSSHYTSLQKLYGNINIIPLYAYYPYTIHNSGLPLKISVFPTITSKKSEMQNSVSPIITSKKSSEMQISVSPIITTGLSFKMQNSPTKNTGIPLYKSGKPSQNPQKILPEYPLKCIARRPWAGLWWVIYPLIPCKLKIC